MRVLSALSLVFPLLFTACDSPSDPDTGGPEDTASYAAEKQFCLDETNRFRATLSLPALRWSDTLEAYADQGARYDAERNKAHAHFAAVKPNPADAENELPGWPKSGFTDLIALVKGGIQLMWDEGPGGGHYENIRGNHTAMGCGFFTTADNRVWMVQDFR